MREKIWIMSPYNERAKILSAELKIPYELTQVLINRNINDGEAAHEFLYGNLEGMHDPYLMNGMSDSVKRIRKAIYLKEKILIFGDYDVDGVLSVVMLRKALKSLGGDVDYYIPHRLKEGYGIKKHHINFILKKNIKLVITVDCGIKAVNFTKIAKEKGVDVIVTDHHLPGSELPDAVGILDPVKNDSGYPDKKLAGVGVVFKLVQALLDNCGKSDLINHYLKLVSIGTVADVVDLTGENRLFVKFGLEALEKVSNKGLKSLLRASGIRRKKVTVGDVGFRIGPRINAAGRMGMADLAVRLFFEYSTLECDEISGLLNQLNSQRQKVEEKILVQALKRIKNRNLENRYKLLVLDCDEWHRGVIGIVASKLKEMYNRPVILFANQNGIAYGSGRSIKEFSIIDCLDECKGFLEEHGGHKLAAGCVLLQKNMDIFKKNVNLIAESKITEEDLKHKIYIDANLDFADINDSFIEKFRLLSPFGIGNPKPVFLVENAEVVKKPQKIKNAHCKLLVRKNGRYFEAFGWRKPDYADFIQQGERINMVYSLQFSNYAGEEIISLAFEDAKKR